MSSVFFEILGAGGIAEALSLVTEKLSNLADKTKLPAMLMFVLGAAVAIFIGVAGYKYIKLISTACFGVAGFIIGEKLFEVAKAHWSWKLPDVVGTLVGLVALALLGYLAYKKFAYALFGVAGFAGFILAYFIYPHYLLAIAAGIIAAMISMYFVRYAFAIITSFGAGFTFMGMVSAMFPEIAMFKLNEGFMGKFFAVSAFLIFVAIQFYITGGGVKKVGGVADVIERQFNGKRRVKIRRVFDAW